MSKLMIVGTFVVIDRKSVLSAFRPKLMNINMAESTPFGRKKYFWPKTISFGQKDIFLSAEHWPKGVYLLAEIWPKERFLAESMNFGRKAKFRPVSAFGQNWPISNSSFGFRPKVFRSITKHLYGGVPCPHAAVFKTLPYPCPPTPLAQLSDPLGTP